jgi:serine/threonine protein kinase
LATSIISHTVEDFYLTRAGDMWLLGTLLYQVMTGTQYWPSHVSDEQILSIMADPTQKLPHQRKAVIPLVQKMLEGSGESGNTLSGSARGGLLSRDPAHRMTADELIKHLQDDMPTAQVTLNPGPIRIQEAVEIAGL